MRPMFILSVLAIMFINNSCRDSNDNPVAYDPDAERLAGNYTATTFILPNGVDRPIDILKLGGSISFSLTNQFKISGRVIIPKEFYSYEEHPPTVGDDYFFSGTYQMIGHDSLRFIGTKDFLSATGFNFRIQGDSLRAEIQGYGVVFRKK